MCLLRGELIAVGVLAGATLAVGAASVTPGQLQSRTGRAAISGVVSDAVTGAPLAGALVHLTDGKVGVSLRVAADARGRFVFLHLPESGGYSLRVSKAGYRADDMSPHPPYRQGAVIALGADEWLRDLSLVMWPLSAVAGQVLDARGRPVVGAPVRLLAEVDVAGTHRWASGPGATTDDLGRYRISSVMAGRYLVHVPSVQSTLPLAEPVLADGTTRGGQVLDWEGAPTVWLSSDFAPRPAASTATAPVFRSQFHPGTPSLAAATILELRPGESRDGVDVWLATEEGYIVSGRVDGPLARPAMTARLVPEEMWGLGVGSETATAVVTPDARFVFAGVPAGTYVLDVRSGLSELTIGTPHLPATPGMTGERYVTLFDSRSGDSAYRSQYVAGDQGWRVMQVVTVPRGGIRDLVAHASVGASISGRVIREDGSEVADARVAVEPADGDPTRGGQPVAGPAARFSIAGLVPGGYILRVTSRGTRVKSALIDGVDLADRPVVIRSTAEAHEVVVTMTDESATVRGRVAAMPGHTPESAGVVIFPADRQLWTEFGLTPRRIKSTAVKVGKEFVFAGLPAGSYLVAAVPIDDAGAWHRNGLLSSIAGRASRVDVDWGQTAVLTVEAGWDRSR